MVYMKYSELVASQNEIINEYNNISVDDLLAKYDCNIATLYKIVEPCLRYKINDVSNDDFDTIICVSRKYKNTIETAIRTGFTHQIVSDIYLNYREKNYASMKKYAIDESYFDVIDTQDKAYILGLLYSDGNVCLKKSCFNLSLQESDRDILNEINKCLKTNKPLLFTDQSNRKSEKNYQYCNMLTLQINNMHMIRKLIGYGVLENKSLLLEFPYWMKEELYPHFIRGYFDGDGSFCSRIAGGYGRRDLITFTSTETFCKALRTVLKYVVGIPGGNIYDASCHNGITKVLSISGYYQTKVLLDWIYSDANLYLKRKHDLYLEKFYS